jgi:hypothetical protein
MARLFQVVDADRNARLLGGDRQAAHQRSLSQRRYRYTGTFIVYSTRASSACGGLPDTRGRRATQARASYTSQKQPLQMRHIVACSGGRIAGQAQR